MRVALAASAKFEAKKRQCEEEAEVKTAKNRAKRQNKKEDKEDTQAHSNSASGEEKCR